jgi:hypothetical protein
MEQVVVEFLEVAVSYIVFLKALYSPHNSALSFELVQSRIFCAIKEVAHHGLHRGTCFHFAFL